ncbi:MAG: DUF1080 domain-containing protein [Pedosphaera sp.]|nr:DUF1080 domain-containing protein [Pedosphaera sp.]
MNRPSLLALAALISLTLTACRSPQKEEKGFVQLFDGKTLKGWTGRPDLWNVRDGAITGETHAVNPLKGNTFLVWTNGTVDNFELRLQYKILNGNSGIQYRSQLQDPDAFVVGGYQADFESGKTYSGILYEERGRGILAQRGQRTHVSEVDGKTKVDVIGSVGDSAAIQGLIHDADWNSYLVIANGNHLMHFINDKMTVDVVDDQAAKAAKSGILALQIHAGPPMLVQFRNIRLLRLP